MDRRIAGVLLLVVALLATLAVPNIIGRRLPGVAAAEVISDPPPVGACVSAIASDPAGTAAARGADALPFRTLPVATVVPCKDAVIGEIISVTAQNTPQTSTLQDDDQARPSCRGQVETYLGTPATTDLLGVEWTKSIYVNAVTVGPDAHDRAAGRTWTACVLSAVGQTYTAPPSLKSSWKSGTLPDVIGLCWADTIVQHGVPTDCSSAHTTQQLAFALVAGPSDSSTSIVLAGCRQLAASIMDVKDPTFGGALAVKVVSDPAGAPYVQCAASATGGRSLVGSLIGLGSQPLPLA